MGSNSLIPPGENSQLSATAVKPLVPHPRWNKINERVEMTKFKQPQNGAKQTPIALGRNTTGTNNSQNNGKDATKYKTNGVIVGGGPLSIATIIAVDAAAAKTPAQWRRYIAYEGKVKVGGSLAWRANNPGNLRDASTKIGSVSGAVGHFAVFANLDEGRTAQKNLYINKYGEMKVRAAINKLTPPSENDTAHYLAELKKAGVDLEKNVSSQIEVLMKAIETNEGLIAGIEVPRIP